MNSVAFPSESGPTIRDIEQRIEHVLDRIRVTSDSTSPTEALAILAQVRELLAPLGLRSTVQLEEGGRKKRSNAAAWNWKFESGEIVLLFERRDHSEIHSTVSSQNPAEGGAIVEMPRAVDLKAEDQDPRVEVQQCCIALSEAEKAGKPFIALKWFRDIALAALQYSWANKEDDRQRVLSAAIDSGAILLKRIPNPKSPMHPTTTVSLNRTSPLVSVPSRFNPVPIKGEPASVTLLRDRGSY